MQSPGARPGCEEGGDFFVNSREGTILPLRYVGAFVQGSNLHLIAIHTKYRHTNIECAPRCNLIYYLSSLLSESEFATFYLHISSVGYSANLYPVDRSSYRAYRAVLFLQVETQSSAHVGCRGRIRAALSYSTVFS